MSDDGLDLPGGFNRWPLADRADYFAFYLNRQGCLDELRKYIKSPRDSDRLSVDELGRLLALLEGNRHIRKTNSPEESYEEN